MVNDGLGFGFAIQFPLLVFSPVMGQEAAGLADPNEGHVQGPILFRLECPDLVLPVHHQPGGHALNPSGGESAAHLFPKERRELIAHNPVQDPSCLLGIHQVIIDVPGMLDGIPDHILGNFIKSDPVRLFVREPEQLL